MASLLKTDHFLIKKLRELDVSGSCLIVATSGGLDSIALLAACHRVQGILPFTLICAHIHHGWITGKQGKFRDRAWQFVSEFCRAKDIPFYSNLLELIPKYNFLIEPAMTLKSEGQLREFRYQCLHEIREELELKYENKCALLTAHTADDLLETQMIRLIRGTGLGGLQAMEEGAWPLLRPLLKIHRDELKIYLNKINCTYLDDPSNDSIDPFRNWLRHRWLPELEAKRPGALASLSRSFSHLTEAKFSEPLGLEKVMLDDFISRPEFLCLGLNEQRQVLANYLRRLGVKNYSTSHINEILKRLDSEQKEHNFTVLKHDWQINAQQIRARPL